MEKLEQHEDELQMRLGTLKSEHAARDDHFSRRLEAITEDLTKAVTSANMAGDRLALNERRIAELQAQVPSGTALSGAASCERDLRFHHFALGKCMFCVCEPAPSLPVHEGAYLHRIEKGRRVFHVVAQCTILLTFVLRKLVSLASETQACTRLQHPCAAARRGAETFVRAEQRSSWQT